MPFRTVYLFVSSLELCLALCGNLPTLPFQSLSKRIRTAKTTYLRPKPAKKARTVKVRGYKARRKVLLESRHSVSRIKTLTNYFRIQVN